MLPDWETSGICLHGRAGAGRYPHHETFDAPIPIPMTPEDLQHITTRTLAHYERNAQDFWEGTRDHDVRQNIDALLSHITQAPPLELLDFGCGPGRDLMHFKALGHRVTGLEGATQLAAMARLHSGCTVLEQ